MNVSIQSPHSPATDGLNVSSSGWSSHSGRNSRVKFSDALALLVAYTFSLTILVGCHSMRIDSEEAVLQQSQRLFEAYLEGDAATARHCLHQEIALLENSKVLHPPRQAFVLFVECSRLYVLEKREGNYTKAELALIKARYWNLRRYELDGNLTVEALAEFNSFTPEKLVEITDKADKSRTKGKGARYIRNE